MTLRTFTQHRHRPCFSLNGLWDFQVSADTAPPSDYGRRINVPAPWQSLPDLVNFSGQAWFRHSVTGKAGKATRVVFAGVSHTGEAYVDGELVGRHYDAFTPWSFLLTDLTEGGNELHLRVDNSFGDHSALHFMNDYHTYGGITRPAEYQWVDSVYIDRLHARPLQEDGAWRLACTATLHNWTAEAGEREVSFVFEGGEVLREKVLVPAGEKLSIERTLEVGDVETWSCETPTLYEIEARLYEGERIVDDLIDRTGFRTVRVEGKEILLNDKPVFLKGYNRHEDHPHFGNALPVEAMYYDLELMRDQHCNFVRTSHYPNDQRFLDLCDELGFLVWEESHARQVKFDRPMFREQIATATREMIEWHYNHPSIILWGCLNECDSHTESGREEYKRVIDLIRELDPHRPVTFASHHHESDLCFDLVDIVSWNLYDCWYGGSLSTVREQLDKRLDWLHGSDESGGQGKPVIISEFGAGGLYGWRQPRATKWTEEYQREALKACLEAYLDHPDLCGVAIWQFCDIRVTDLTEGCTMWNVRPRNMNNKGIVDEYRRPKLAYDVVKSLFAEAR